MITGSKIRLNDEVSLFVKRVPYGFNYELYSGQFISPIFSIIIQTQHINKAALCVGGAVYGYYNDSVLAESVIKLIE